MKPTDRIMVSPDMFDPGAVQKFSVLTGERITPEKEKPIKEPKVLNQLTLEL
jgi:hypothetical protein